MLYGMMGLLIEYIEKEKPLEHIDWDHDEFHRQTRDEFLAIRDWWLNYDNRCKEIEKALNDWHDERFKGAGDNWLERLNEPDTPESKRLSDRLNELEKKFEDEETDMLVRLVKIRKYLWT
jgi:hypothetical protein